MNFYSSVGELRIGSTLTGLLLCDFFFFLRSMWIAGCWSLYKFQWVLEAIQMPLNCLCPVTLWYNPNLRNAQYTDIYGFWHEGALSLGIKKTSKVKLCPAHGVCEVGLCGNVFLKVVEAWFNENIHLPGTITRQAFLISQFIRFAPY